MRFLKLRLILTALIAITAVVSCQKDDEVVQNIDQADQYIPDVKAFTLNGNQLNQKYPEIGERINNLNSLRGRFTTAQQTQQLDTTNIKVIQLPESITYIFRVFETMPTPDRQKNYLLVKLRDSLVHQYMVDYKINDDGSVDIHDTFINPIFGDDLLNQTRVECGGTGTFQSFWVEGYTIEHTCSGGPNHTVSDGEWSSDNPGGCRLWGGPGGPTVTVVLGHWETRFVEQVPCLTIDDPSNGTSPGGGSSGGSTGGDNDQNTPPDDDDPGGTQPQDPVGIGFVPNLIDEEEDDCEKLKKFMESTDINHPETNRQYIYRDLRMHTLNNNFEKGQLINEVVINDESTRDYTEVVGQPFSNGINLPNVPSDGSMIGLIHTHWEGDGRGGGLSPLFSMSDMLYFALIASRRHNSGKELKDVVFILVSHTGAVYALKLNDINKVIQFLRDFYQNNPGEKNQEVAKDTFDKYVIRGDNLKSQESRFLEKIGNAGISVYAFDTDNDEWEEVVDDSSNGNRKPC